MLMPTMQLPIALMTTWPGQARQSSRLARAAPCTVGIVWGNQLLAGCSATMQRHRHRQASSPSFSAASSTKSGTTKANGGRRRGTSSTSKNSGGRRRKKKKSRNDYGSSEDEGWSADHESEELLSEEEDFMIYESSSGRGRSRGGRRRSQETYTRSKSSTRRRGGNQAYRIQAKGGFWGWMEQFWAPLENVHLNLMRPSTRTDSIFSIPRLGKHYLDKWAAEDGYAVSASTGSTSSSRRPPSSSSAHRVTLGGPTAAAIAAGINTEEFQYTGQFTERLLASLVIEANDGSNRGAASDDLLLNAQGGSKRRETKKRKKSLAVPIDTAPTLEYTAQLVTGDEAKVKAELAQVGVLDNPDFDLPSNQKEDDEICEHLRNLHQRLRQYAEANNRMKKAAYGLVQRGIVRQQRQDEKLKRWADIEKQYKALQKRQNKRRKK